VAKTALKKVTRLKRKVRVRKKIVGSSARPRLCVFKSARHIYAQLIDDSAGVTIASCSTLSDSAEGLTYTGNSTAAIHVGKEIAQLAIAKNITSVVFDRNGFLYHGRIKALADAARESGLLF
jgi:large subunit ribosomal protein L18